MRQVAVEVAGGGYGVIVVAVGICDCLQESVIHGRDPEERAV